MWASRIGAVAFLALTQAAIVMGQQPVNPNAALERLKGLRGTWSIDNGRPGAQSVATFRSAAGNVLVLDEGGQLTVFHMDNDRLTLTHYCGTGNQPRMRLQAGDDRKLSFAMYDITNLANPKAYHTSGLEVVFLSDDRVDLLYRGTRDGRDSTQRVQLTRKKS